MSLVGPTASSPLSRYICSTTVLALARVRQTGRASGWLAVAHHRGPGATWLPARHRAPKMRCLRYANPQAELGFTSSGIACSAPRRSPPGDSSYRTIRGILAVGTDRGQPAAPTGAAGCWCVLAQARLFRGHAPDARHDHQRRPEGARRDFGSADRQRVPPQNAESIEGFSPNIQPVCGRIVASQRCRRTRRAGRLVRRPVPGEVGQRRALSRSAASFTRGAHTPVPPR
jgi:hypothetical protein